MKLILPCLAAMVFGSAAYAGTASPAGFYAQGSIFATQLNDQDFIVSGIGRTELDYDVGFGVSGAVGYNYRAPFRSELEFSYRSNAIDEPGLSGEFDALAVMVNGYYDIENLALPVIPYVGGGIGLAELSPDGADDTVFAYQLMAGVSYPLQDNLSAILGYRYFATQDADYRISGFNIGTSYDTHNLELGVRFGF